MKCLPAAVSAAILILPLTSGAQIKTDFTGTWTMDPARSESTRQGEPVKAVTIVIVQSAPEVRIETTRGEEKEAVVYPFGQPSRAAGNAADAALQAEAYWEDDKLVTQSQRQVQGYAVTVKEVRSLASGGREMIMETTVLVQHGYTMPGIKNYGTARDVFTKTNP